jgi:transcriptional regulator with XRE-family HTH domain
MTDPGPASGEQSTAAGYVDALATQALIDELVELRKVAGLSQTDVARLMGVDQPAVQKFETRKKPPMLLTVQRYARAVGARLCATVCETEPERVPHGDQVHPGGYVSVEEVAQERAAVLIERLLAAGDEEGLLRLADCGSLADLDRFEAELNGEPERVADDGEGDDHGEVAQ